MGGLGIIRNARGPRLLDVMPAGGNPRPRTPEQIDSVLSIL
jgi:hypothetical protein